MKLFLTTFIAIFIAELGDKTQLATLLFAANKDVSKWLIFFAAASALILTSAIGVLVGSGLSQFISEKTLKTVAGMGFIIIGTWTLISK
jgi:putative Ca2+/H+ antiporter (TMEM165/GDT1 family)